MWRTGAPSHTDIRNASRHSVPPEKLLRQTTESALFTCTVPQAATSSESTSDANVTAVPRSDLEAILVKFETSLALVDASE